MYANFAKYLFVFIRFGTFCINRYRRKRSKVNASVFDSALSHTRRSNTSEKKENSVVALRSLLNVFACGQVSSPRLYRLKSIIDHIWGWGILSMISVLKFVIFEISEI